MTSQRNSRENRLRQKQADALLRNSSDEIERLMLEQMVQDNIRRYAEEYRQNPMLFCRCNRPLGPVAHCPLCGSRKCYALASRIDKVTRPDGSTDALRVFHCTNCKTKFNDDDWRLRCNAPEYRVGRPRALDTMQSQPTVKFKDLSEVPPELRDALDAIKRNRGIK